jgi:large subunit ribosomal protein L29
MKISDLRKMSSKDLRAKLLENSESLQKYRFQKSIQQLEDYKVIKEVKKENAKILTILSQLDDMEESNG